MASNESYEFECTKKCRSFVHGGVITAACTKRSVPDQVLLRFLAKLCKNFAEVADKEVQIIDFTLLECLLTMSMHNRVDQLCIWSHRPVAERDSWSFC